MRRIARQKSVFWPNTWLHRILCDGQLLSTRLSADTRLSINACWNYSATDGGPSSGVSQSRCKSVYGTESHAPVNTRREEKRREENVLIYAAIDATFHYSSQLQTWLQNKFVRVYDMLSTFLSKTWSRTCCINLDMSRLMQQVRWFVRVLNKWNVEKSPDCSA